MSRACSELRRIWQNNRHTTRPAIATPPLAAETRASRPSTITYNLLKEPSVDVLASTFKIKSASSSFRNRYPLYIYTVERLARHQRFSAIEEILESHKKYDEIASESFAVRLITLYGAAGMFRHAHNLFEELPSLNCRRSVVSFNALLGAALHSKEFECVRELFDAYSSKLGVDPDVVSYNTLIKALVELGSVDVAISMVDEMKGKALEPDLITFNSVVGGAYGKKGFSEGEKVWDLMLEKIKHLVPDIKSYNAKLSGMVNEGMVSEAVDLFEELNIRGLQANTFTYNHLIKGFCDRGDLEEAKKWYRKLVDSDDLLPNWITFETLIRALCDNGDTDLAFDLSKRMLGRHFLVDEALLQMVVDELVKDSKVGKAKKLVQLARVNYYHQYNLVMPSAE